MWLRARQDKDAGGDARAPMSGIEVIVEMLQKNYLSVFREKQKKK